MFAVGAKEPMGDLRNSTRRPSAKYSSTRKPSIFLTEHREHYAAPLNPVFRVPEARCTLTEIGGPATVTSVGRVKSL